MAAHQFTEDEAQSQGGRKNQPGIGRQVVSSKATRMRSRWLRDSICLVLLVEGWVSVLNPLSQIQRSTFSPLQHTPNTYPFGGFVFRRR